MDSGRPDVCYFFPTEHVILRLGYSLSDSVATKAPQFRKTQARALGCLLAQNSLPYIVVTIPSYQFAFESGLVKPLREGGFRVHSPSAFNHKIRKQGEQSSFDWHWQFAEVHFKVQCQGQGADETKPWMWQFFQLQDKTLGKKALQMLVKNLLKPLEVDVQLDQRAYFSKVDQAALLAFVISGDKECLSCAG